MSYTIQTKKALASNKPPAPSPEPNKELFPNPLDMNDGRKVWISVPMPDKLSLVIPIMSEVMGASCPENHPPEEISHAIASYLLSEPWNSHVIDYKMHYNQPTYHRIRLRMGHKGGSVTFTFLNSKKEGNRLKIEFNPRRLGNNGNQQLALVLMGSDPGKYQSQLFRHSKFAEYARLTRLDVAVDIVGISVDQILVWHRRAGKRSTYASAAGRLETMMVHAKKKPPSPKTDKWGYAQAPKHGPNPAGAVLVKLYDKVKERAALLQAPSYGEAPICRVEIVRKRFMKKFLKDIPSLNDPFSELRVGWVSDQIDKPYRGLFLKYATLRRATRSNEAAKMLGLLNPVKLMFEAALEVPNLPLISKKLNWTQWQQGLQQTGLAFLINAADELETPTSQTLLPEIIGST